MQTLQESEIRTVNGLQEGLTTDVSRLEVGGRLEKMESTNAQQLRISVVPTQTSSIRAIEGKLESENVAKPPAEQRLLFKDVWLDRKVAHNKVEPKEAAPPKKEFSKAGGQEIKATLPKINLIRRPPEKIRGGLFGKLSVLREEIGNEIARRRILNRLRKGKKYV